MVHTRGSYYKVSERFFCKLKLPFQYFKLSSLVRGLSLKHGILGNWKTQGSKKERKRKRERKRVSGIPRDNIGQGRRCPSKPTFPVFLCTLFPHIFPRGNFNIAKNDQTFHISNPWLILLGKENWKVIKLKKKNAFQINVTNVIWHSY